MSKTRFSSNSRRRNWKKMQLLGMCTQLNAMQISDRDILTETDMIRIGTAKAIINHILNDWDESSLKLGFKPRKCK